MNVITREIKIDNEKIKKLLNDEKGFKMKEGYFFLKEKPEYLVELDKEIRKIFKLHAYLDFIVSLYTGDNIKIENNVQNSFNNIIMDTIDEEVEYFDKNTKGKYKKEIKKNRAYQIKLLSCKHIEYHFSDKKFYNNQEKKGRKKIRKHKDIENRIIIKFDYLIDVNHLSDIFGKFNNELPEVKDESKGVELDENELSFIDNITKDEE